MSLSEKETVSTTPATHRGHSARYLRPALAVLALLCGTATIYAGSQGLGEPLTYQEAPTVAKPFTAADPNTYTGTTSPPEMPPSTIAIPALGITAQVAESDIDASGALILPASEKNNQVHRSRHSRRTRRLHRHNRPCELRRRLPRCPCTPRQDHQVDPHLPHRRHGGRHEYKANTAETLTKTQLPQELFSPTGLPQLVLITCGGPIDDTGSILEYTHNTVVTAAPATVP